MLSLIIRVILIIRVDVINGVNVINDVNVVNDVNVINGAIYVIRHASAANHVKVILQDERSAKVINHLIYRPIT